MFNRVESSGNKETGVCAKEFPDERGFFAEVLRDDWKELLGQDRIVQANLSMSYPGVVRVWHRHNRGQVDYVIVLRGAMRVCAYDGREDSETKGQLDEVVASAERLQVVARYTEYHPRDGVHPRFRGEQ